MYNIYFLIIVSIVILNFVWGQILGFLNRKRMSPDIPDELQGIYEPSVYQKQQLYQKTLSRFGLFSGGFSLIVLLIVLSLGLLGWVDILLRTSIDHFILLPLLFFLLLFIINEILELPFGYYATFSIEEKFGFNQSTPRLFLTDWVKGILLSVVIGGLILTALVMIYEYTGKYFWLLGWITVSVFSVLMSFFYSEWIVPLFNKQTSLEEGELRHAIKSFSQTAGFELKDIYVIDGSKRSTKANAYFSGFGKKKRIVLFDTLMKELSIEEIVAVLAHEIGHYKKKHILYTMVISVLTTGIAFFILSLFLESTPLAEALGGHVSSFHLGLIGFSLLYVPVSEIMSVWLNRILRKHEYEADAFAAQWGLGEALINGLKKLSVQSLSNLNPHPWVVYWYYSHPTLLQRIRSLRLLGSTND